MTEAQIQLHSKTTLKCHSKYFILFISLYFMLESFISGQQAILWGKAAFLSMTWSQREDFMVILFQRDILKVIVSAELSATH